MVQKLQKNYRKKFDLEAIKTSLISSQRSVCLRTSRYFAINKLLRKRDEEFSYVLSWEKNGTSGGVINHRP